MKRSSLFILTLALAASAQAAIQTKIIEYKEGDTILEGVIVFDDAVKTKRPGVLIVHQWMGLSAYEKKRAEMLAQLGYVAFCADIYGKGVRPQPPAAGQEAGKYKKDRALLRARLTAALDVLKNDARTDAAKLAATGYCFGGTSVLELARAGADLKGVVSFHGGLDSPKPADGKNIKGKVLALHGADDPYVPAKDVAAFEKELQDAKVDYKLIKYPGAVHSFTHREAGNDNSKGAAYNEAADKASWSEMKAFLSGVFGGK